MSATGKVDWSHRAALIGAWHESGLPLKDWAAAQGLSESRVTYWIKRLRLSRKTALAETAPLTLAAVQIASPSNNSAPTLYLHSPGGWKVTVPASFGSEQLLVLLRGLP